MPRRFILWDIDGTLLTTGPVGRLAIESGARLVTGLDELPHVVMSGKTDPQIVREILSSAGVPHREIDEVLPRALEESERFLEHEGQRMRSEGRVHPGVADLLEALSTTISVRQSLLTGNIAPNAYLKVHAFGLEHFLDLPIGAYGTDHADRNLLVPFALRRVRELRGEDYRPDEVWVIGDTANDLSCARAGGVRCLIVGTGHDGFDAVQDLEADAVLEDLSDTELVLKILLAS